MNSFSFLSGKLFICPLILNDIFAGLSNLNYRSLKILSLFLTFGILFMMCLGMGLFASILFGTLCASWTCMSIFFTKLGKFSFIIFSNRFPISYCFLLHLTSLWCEWWTTWSCLGGYLLCLWFFFILFFFLLFWLVGLLPYASNHRFDSWLHSLYCSFPINYSLFQLVCPSFLTGSFLCCWGPH